MNVTKKHFYHLLVTATVCLSSQIGYTAVTANSCPANNQRYEISKDLTDGTFTKVMNATVWPAGTKTNTFTYPDGTNITLTFSNLLRPPTYGYNAASYKRKDTSAFANTPSIDNGYYYDTSTAITKKGYLEITHDASATGTSHIFSLSSNRNITQAGFILRQFNKGSNFQEGGSLDNGGVFNQLSTANYFTLSNNNSSITTNFSNGNCADNNYDNCSVSTMWGSKNANTILNFTHTNNLVTSTKDTHFTAYDGFYICLPPPTLTVKKVLDGTRSVATDQFKITTTGGTINNSFTTTGSGSSLNSGVGIDNSGTLTAATGITYNIAETASSGSLANYTTTYDCKNTNTSNSVMPTGTGSSFSISNLNNGDAVTCTVTNKPIAYTFSGTVFNDYKSTNTNTNYDGLLNGSETGILGASVKLTDCKSPETVLATTPTAADGTYNFNNISKATIGSLTNVCVIETNATGYPNDTSKNTINVPITSGTYNYTNNNFGDVQTSLLTLVKSQALVDCNSSTDLATLTSYTTDPLSKTTDNKDIPSGSCIAYKIEAKNIGNVALSNVIITDSLENGTYRKSYMYASPAPKVCYSSTGTCTTTLDPASVQAPNNGTVKTASFGLPSQSTATLYFKVQYNKV